MPNSKQAIINLLEEERRKFENKDYTPPQRLLSRCRSSCLRLLNARHNLKLILKKSAELFVLRVLSENATNIGLRREYGLVPILLAWWALVPHPPTLTYMAREICAEFGLQYPEAENNENGDSLGAEATPSYNNITGIEVDKEPLPLDADESSLHKSMYDEIHQAQFPGQSLSTSQIPRPEDQPPQSVLSFQKLDLLDFLNTPHNIWGTSALANFLPFADSDMRMVMAWTGAPPPRIEIKFELPIDFSEAFMKFRQARLNNENIVQTDAHKTDSFDQALRQ
ncbi:hypothetical protein BDW59DRAFT_178373 [Aspergillus cavernicola]|uniref:Uncharacterized protein n=1 Tax=Aspergillus cavernicola TaxID=176166 RepID=A0ABR4HBP8_9EURO